MIMHTEIVGRPRSGKTTALLTLYQSFTSQGLNPAVLLPTQDQVRFFKNHYSMDAYSSQEIPRLNGNKAFLIDGIELFPTTSGEGEILALVKKSLQLHSGIRIIVSTRTAEPGENGG